MPETARQKGSLDKLLEEHFSITTGLHIDQREIIEQLLQGQRILAIQRTGWGKSLCYQLTSLLLPSLTLVLSPLKALMREQCSRCNHTYALPSAVISSDFTIQENLRTLQQALKGKIKILFIAPERLESVDWLAHFPQMQISLVVIDEAHCISTWGHDFRPHYRRIARFLRTQTASPAVLALTATANTRVEADILQQIGPAQVIRGSLYRPNLHLQVVRLYSDWEKLCYLGEVLREREDTGIIYTPTRNCAAMVAQFLKTLGIGADYYHSGRANAVLQEVERKLLSNQLRVVCSTAALSMGIDKRDIRFVIHYCLPDSLMSYYQEIGRAGRDGGISWCILLYNPSDFSILQQFLQIRPINTEHYQTVITLLSLHSEGISEEQLLLLTDLPQTTLRAILTELEEQLLIDSEPMHHMYRATSRLATAQSNVASDLSQLHQELFTHKQKELEAVHLYAQTDRCYMNYVITYLGDQQGKVCGICGNCCAPYFPPVLPSKRIQEGVTYFLEEKFLPRIEAHASTHEAGWSLSYHDRTVFGKLVSNSKQRNCGPFALSIVLRAVEVVRMRYPIQHLQAVMSIPPTKSGMLVEIFARQVAEHLSLPYLSLLKKTRSTGLQKHQSTQAQKMENVQNAFVVQMPEDIVGRVILLIDDIYDSGSTLREVGGTLMRAGVKEVYPLTITRTMYMDDHR